MRGLAPDMRGMTLKDNLTRWLGVKPMVQPGAPLYARAMELAREPAWFSAGGVPDTIDGRFDMLALVVSLVMTRLQALGAIQTEADLTDRFADDMDAQLRHIGVSDLSIAKGVGNTVGALGGRLGAYRAAIGGDDAALADALARNLYRGAAPEPGMLDWALRETRALWTRIGGADAATLAAGRL